MVLREDSGDHGHHLGNRTSRTILNVEIVNFILTVYYLSPL